MGKYFRELTRITPQRRDRAIQNARHILIPQRHLGYWDADPTLKIDRCRDRATFGSAIGGGFQTLPDNVFGMLQPSLTQNFNCSL